MNINEQLNERRTNAELQQSWMKKSLFNNWDTSQIWLFAKYRIQVLLCYYAGQVIAEYRAWFLLHPLIIKLARKCVADIIAKFYNLGNDDVFILSHFFPGATSSLFRSRALEECKLRRDCQIFNTQANKEMKECVKTQAKGLFPKQI